MIKDKTAQAWNVARRAEIRAAEQAFMAQPGLLMARAARQIANDIEAVFGQKLCGQARTDPANPDKSIWFLIGKGKNGGDGLTAAKMLKDQGWKIKLYAVQSETRLRQLWPALLLDDEQSFTLDALGPVYPLQDFQPGPGMIVVDALFGIGFRPPLDRTVRTVLERCRAASVHLVSIDMPSGVGCDHGDADPGAARASRTITFTAMKPGLLLLPGAAFAGQIVVADIGIQIPGKISCNHPESWRADVPVPNAESHKYKRGHLMVFAGLERPGAAILAARAARRFCGAVSLCIHQSLAPAVRIHWPGLMVQSLRSTDHFIDAVRMTSCSAVLIGPGAGLDQLVRSAICAILQMRIPTVIDGDGLSIFQDRAQDLFEKTHSDVVLTPHMGEFKRIFGDLEAMEKTDKLTMALAAASMAACPLILKGRDSIMVAPNGQARLQVKASPWLATAGSGDVLAGITAGLMAGRVQPFQAASIASWLLGQCADQAGPGLIAEDLIEQL
ncbi:MAG: NAD(P)H-hydrate dehydratase, partial [Pseudomonadota bacterium]